MNTKSNKWHKADQADSRTTGYTPAYAKNNPSRYSPKRTVRSFRDLEVYQVTMECAVIVSSEVVPILEKDTYVFVEGMHSCALTVPLLVAEAHGQRFSNFSKSLQTLEAAMQGCSKMVVYLDQGGQLSVNLDEGVVKNLTDRYVRVRGKMLRLQRSWQKFQTNNP